MATAEVVRDPLPPIKEVVLHLSPEEAQCIRRDMLGWGRTRLRNGVIDALAQALSIDA